VLETLQAIRVPGEGRGKYLDCHLARQPRIAGAIHLAHAPFSKKARYLERAQPVARLISHP
jgi:hypothetical protein